MTEPQTWGIPEEPGPEVTAVRDRHGDVWKREGDAWRFARRLGALSTWDGLLRHEGPLTDASDEEDR